MLYYSNQPILPLFEAATPTVAFAGNQKTFDTAGFSKLSLDLDYAMGAGETGNTLDFSLEASNDGITWFSLVIDETGATSVITPRVWQMAAGRMNVLVDIAYKFMRISIKETGVVTNFGATTIKATLSGL